MARRYGAYDKAVLLAKPDGRTCEAKLLRESRAALFDHLGGENRLTAPQRMLVERASMLQLRLAVLDRKILDRTFTEYDSKVYTACGNSLTRTLIALGIKGAPPTPPRSLAAINREIAAQEAAAD